MMTCPFLPPSLPPSLPLALPNHEKTVAMINMIPSIQGVNFKPSMRKLLQAPFGICIILYTYIYIEREIKRRRGGREGGREGEKEK
jgi:hypothetical protein